MRRLAGPTSGRLCQQQRGRSPWHAQRRCYLNNTPHGSIISWGKGPLKRKFPTFEVPNLVLDLDAVDSPHVRPFDEKEDGLLQRSRWGHDPAIDEAKEFAREMTAESQRDLQKLRSVKTSPHKALREVHISDHEVMTVALLGGSSVHGILQDDRNATLRQALLEYGVPTAILQLGASSVIPFMLQRQGHAQAALKDSPLGTGETADGQAVLFEQELEQCHSLQDVKKMCAQIDSPISGIEYSVDLIDLVHNRLLQIAQTSNSELAMEDYLSFVNNLTIRSLSANKPLARSMTLLGLQLSTRLGLLPCILQYIQICLSIDLVAQPVEAVADACSEACQALLAALERGDGMARGTRQQIFTMVTGWGAGGSGPQPSLLGGQQNPGDFELSVRLMGELGALRLLWHYYRAQKEDDLFVGALQRCAQLLGRIKDDGLGLDLTTSAGGPEGDAVLDSQLVNAIEASYIASGRRMPTPSASTLDDCISREEIVEAFNKSDITSAMQHFGELIDRARAVYACIDEAETGEEEEEEEGEGSLTEERAPPLEGEMDRSG